MVLRENEEPAAPNGAAGRPPQQDRKHRLKHRFEVSKKLGQGTYGKVQLAINKETGQEVAIKTIKKSKIESEQDLVRIRREIQIMSSIQHPHIIHIYEVFENKEKIVLVMQYASGGELYDYLSEKKALQDVDARRIFRQIACSVYYCHKNKICHRDLKLENVLMDERGNAKIADFGLSNVFDERHLLGTFCGSPLYASPEIVKGTPYYGPEVDCWSLGVLLYTLVYGAMPFDGSNFKRLVKQISEGDYYEPKKKSEASGLIRRLLTVSPAKRATIIDICTDWWVNLGYEHSLLQVSEDMANLTPVRIDLLLALAPSSPTPPAEADALRRQNKTKEGQDSKADDSTDMSSSSFAFISGGMASEMKQIKTENPDDIFHENDEESDEEFLSADAAAELEGLNDYEEQFSTKRRAEKSFDGSMVRVSSIAHKTKKPRKSESVQKQTRSQAVLEPQQEEVEDKKGTGDLQVDTPEQLQDDNLNMDTEKEVTDLKTTGEKTPIAEASPDSANIVLETSIPPSESAGDSKTSQTEPASQVVSEEVPSAAPVEDTTLKTDKNTPQSAEVATQPAEKKKVKRKIISSKKLAADKVAKDKVEGKQDKQEAKAESPKREVKSSPEKTPVKSRSPVKTVKDRSPSKGKESPRRPSLEPKDQTRKSSVDNKDAVHKTTGDSKGPSRRTSVDSKEGSRRPSAEPRESPRKSSIESKDSTRSKSPKKAEPPKPADKPKPTPAGTRRPGKLVMPKFLDSAQSSSSPKSADVKKLVLPIRSVSDAKRSFEVKNKSSPPKSCEAKKTTEVSTPEADKVDTLKGITNTDEILVSDLKQSEDTSPVPTTQPTADVKASESNVVVGDVSKSPTSPCKESMAPEEGDKKKAGAKSILIKSIAKARLHERKLSQQNSLDSETGSVTSPVVGSPVFGSPVLGSPVIGSPVISKVTNVPFLKTPKPYVKEDPTTLKSHAEIILTDRKESLPNVQPLTADPKSEDESIWGVPLSSPGERQLKRSVLSSSIESDMNNWRHEVEESLKRLSPEGASEDPTRYSSHQNAEMSETGPTPISRSYKKFTFNKDGTCTTETGEIYTKPENNGTWTKVEKSTKVTTQPESSKIIPETLRSYREMSPLRHSDSQSSSGSNDIFDDIFDTWSGDTMFGNLLKGNSLFGRMSKDPFRRRERQRDSLRRPKSSKKAQQEWSRSDKRPGNLTDKDSSDNEDDFDLHFDGSHNMGPGSPDMFHFMRSMNKDFKNHLRAFKERHLPSYSRSLSRDRGDPISRGRDSTPRNGQGTMTRSVSRDRAQSPPETVVRFVIESPKRQTSVRSEPRGYNREESWSSKPKFLPDESETDILGRGARHFAPTSEFPSRFTTLLNSPDPFFDRTSLYGTIRPKAHQRYQKPVGRETPGSPLTPQSNRSGPELVEKPQYEFSPENRRQKVETWLQTNVGEAEEKDLDPYLRSRIHLQNLPESRVYHPVTTRTYAKYNRSNTELPDQDYSPHLTRDQRSESLTNLEHKREPHVVHYGPPSDYRRSQERPDTHESRWDQSDPRHTLNSPDCPVPDKPPRQSSLPHVDTLGNRAYARSMSNTPFRVIASPESVIEMETPGTGSPMVRMRVSFNPNPGGSSSPRENPVVTSPGISEGIWNQETNSRTHSNIGDDSLSLLEALKTRGYRNVISQQRFQHEPMPREMRPEEAPPIPSEVSGQARSQQDSPQRGKASSYGSAESENNACCMDTNPADSDREDKSNGEPPLIEMTKKKSKKNGEEASDGTLSPDSLDFSREKLAEFKPPNLEEESVSERIRRKSYFLRFNEDRPKRRPSYREADFLPDYRAGLWTRFSVEDELDEIPVAPRRTNRKNNFSTEKRSSASLDDFLDDYDTQRFDSGFSHSPEVFLSDDGLWSTYSGTSKPRFTNGHTASLESTMSERPGSLWTHRGRHKVFTEPSVVDTVPDLGGERRWTSRSSFSFYSPIVTPRSPILPHQTLLSSDSNQKTSRRGSLNEVGDCALSEESDSNTKASEDCPRLVDIDPNEIILGQD